MSPDSFEIVPASEASAKETILSVFPRLICAAITFRFIPPKPSRSVVNCLLIGNEEPYPAAEPNGF